MITDTETKITPRTRAVLEAGMDGSLERDLREHRTYVMAALAPTGLDEPFDPAVVQICFDYGWIEMPLLAPGQRFVQLRTTHAGTTMLGVRRTNAAGVR